MSDMPALEKYFGAASVIRLALQMFATTLLCSHPAIHRLLKADSFNQFIHQSEWLRLELIGRIQIFEATQSFQKIQTFIKHFSLEKRIKPNLQTHLLL